MKNDTVLVNIYQKIHAKKPLTMDDLRYLAKYSPECFEKTCKNVVYNFPEAKPVMEPQTEKKQNINLRNTPQIKFILDQSIEYGVRMSKKIDEVTKDLKDRDSGAEE